nr:hypothetical protein [Ezakiella coagulans]
MAEKAERSRYGSSLKRRNLGYSVRTHRLRLPKDPPGAEEPGPSGKQKESSTTGSGHGPV